MASSVSMACGIRTTAMGNIADVSTGTAFTATVSAITDAFGDPTRRSVYLFARERSRGNDGEAPEGVTASTVAKLVGVHPNVARHHLDKLAAGGYLEVVTAKPSGTAGRPSKHYVAVGGALDEATFPVRSDDLVLSLLGRTLSKLAHDEAEQMAEEVGSEYGRAMAAGLTGDAFKAGQRSLRSAIQAVADALSAHGFAAHAEGRNDQLKIINNHCPFGDIAAEHPVICAVDRGMVRGMLSELYKTDDDDAFRSITTDSSLAAGDTFCTTSV